MTAFVGRVDLGRPIRCRGGPAHASGDLIVFRRGFIANGDALTASFGATAVGEPDLFAAAYRRWGPDLAHHVLGQFAVAIVDTTAGEVLLTQDSLSIQPLYFTADDAGVAFASHLHLLAEAGGLSALDEIYIADHLQSCRHLGARTPYHGVSRMTGGSLLWRHREIRRFPGWSLDDQPEVRLKSDAAYEDAFRDLIGQAVVSAVPSGRKTWIELSGGLDSSTIACAAAEAGLGFEAVSIVHPATRAADESPWMAKVVEQRQLPWRTLDGDALAPFSRWPDVVFGEPNMSICTFAHSHALLAMAKQNGVEVILSGNGGDHVLIGDRATPVHLADALLQGRLRSLGRELGLWRKASLPLRSHRHWLEQAALRPALDRLLGRPIRSGAELTRPAWIDPRLSVTPTHRARRPGRSVGEQHYIERVSEVGALLAANVHQFPGAPDYRYPLLYRPLVAFMHAIPWSQRLVPGADRHLQRRALAGLLPKAIVKRVTKGSIAQPCIDGLRAAGPRLLDDLCQRSRMVERGFVDGGAWRRAVTLASHGMVENLSQFMAAASLEIWLRQIETKTGPAGAPWSALTLVEPGQLADRQSPPGAP